MAMRSRLLTCALFLSLSGIAAEQKGQVTFGGLPLPGATVTAGRAGQTFTTVTDPQGRYLFPDLPDGAWTIHVNMLLFAPVQRDVTVGPGAPEEQWELTLLPSDQIRAVPMSSAPAAPQPPPPPPVA